MGDFRITIKAVGDHGRDRTKKEGESVNFYDDGDHTPEAIAKTMVQLMKYHGCIDIEAEIVHWPGQDEEVVDDLVTGIRKKGNF